MAAIPVGKGLWQEALGKALLSHAHGPETLSAVLICPQRWQGWLGSLPADPVR